MKEMLFGAMVVIGIVAFSTALTPWIINGTTHYFRWVDSQFTEKKQ